MLRSLIDAVKIAGANSTSKRSGTATGGFEARLNSLEGKLVVLQWMVGANTVLTFVVLLKVLSANSSLSD